MTRTYLRCDANVFEEMKEIPSYISSGMPTLETMEPDECRPQEKRAAGPLIRNPMAGEGEV